MRKEAKRCSGCGAVALSESIVCRACDKPRMRPLSDDERRTWEQVESEGAALAARAVGVRCPIQSHKTLEETRK